jgi:putative ABC transport system permease protein
VQVVSTVKGFKGLAGPYVWCSANTARGLLRALMPADQCTYILAQCKKSADPNKVVRELDELYGKESADHKIDMTIFTKEDFAYHSKMHWLKKTKAGIAIGYAALLGLLVGMVVTSQTLYAATTASAREYAILLALGIPRWRVSLTVLNQSFWVGIIGVTLSFPAVLGLKELAKLAGANVLLEPWLLSSSAGVTMVVAMVAGFFALRSVRKIEPMSLLR